MPCCPMPGRAPARLSRTPTSSRAGLRPAAIRPRPSPISAASAFLACMGCNGSPSPTLASSTCATARRRRRGSPPASAASTATPTGSGDTIPSANGPKSLLSPSPMRHEGCPPAAQNKAAGLPHGKTRSSIDRDAGRLHDFGPAKLLLCNVRRQLFRRGLFRFGAHPGKGVLDLRAGERTSHGLAQLLPDGNRSAGRRDNEIDRRGDESIESALHHGRELRRQGAAPFARYSQAPQAAVTDI